MALHDGDRYFVHLSKNTRRSLGFKLEDQDLKPYGIIFKDNTHHLSDEVEVQLGKEEAVEEEGEEGEEPEDVNCSDDDGYSAGENAHEESDGCGRRDSRVEIISKAPEKGQSVSVGESIVGPQNEQEFVTPVTDLLEKLDREEDCGPTSDGVLPDEVKLEELTPELDKAPLSLKSSKVCLCFDELPTWMYLSIRVRGYFCV